MSLKENIYIDLKGGDKVVLRNGDVLFYDEYYKKITNAEDSRINYTDTLRHKSNRDLDIVKVKRATEYETIFDEDDRDEDDVEFDVDEIVDRVVEELDGKRLTKGSTIVINL